MRLTFQVGCALAAGVLITGCSTPDADAPTSSSTVAASIVASGATGSGTADSSSASATPVTEPGTLTGPGVDDTEIAVGTLIDRSTDRGLLQGLELWRDSVNANGGVCQRTIRFASSGADGVSDDLPAAYRDLGDDVIGFVTSTESGAVGGTLATMLSSDQIPALTTSGTANDLLFASPVVIGPTADIIAINAADQLLSSGELSEGQSVGVVSDGSAVALNAIEGLRWFAEQHDLTVKVQSSTVDTTLLRSLPVVFALTSPSVTAELAAALPVSTIVVTTLSGYDPSLISEAEAQHLDIAVSTPAVGSDFPGAVAITAALAQAGRTPGSSTFAGYAVGVTWQRLLTAACEGQNLTRAGITAAMSTIGPASLESVLGASDTALPVNDQQPATRSSALAAADLSAPSGLRPLTSLIVADGIDTYAAGLR